MTIVDESKLFILAAGIIIDPKGRLLVVRKQNTHKYMLPGGKIDEGESPIEALMRELHEQKGKERYPEGINRNHRTDTNLFFILLPELIEIAPAAEIAEAIWITPKDIPNYDFAPLMTSFVIPTWLDLVNDIGESLGFDSNLDA